MLPPPPLSVAATTLLDAFPTILASAIISIATATELPAATGTPVTALTSAAAGSQMAPHDHPSNGECQLLGSFALIVQGALGGFALLALVYKRWRERPQRPLKIWTFDVSKQVVGSVLLHIANLLMSMLSSGQFSIKLGPKHVARDITESTDHYVPNPCSFYLLNLAIDTTIGIPILIFLLRILTGLFAMTPLGNPPESIQSGNYGQPPRASWWFKQSIIYFLGLLGMKICVLIIFLIIPWISRIGDWALRWTEGNEQLQVFFVMLFFPVVMNAAQYYIIDSFIQNQKPNEHEPLAGDDRDSYTGEDHIGPFEDPMPEDADNVEVAGEGELSQKGSVEIKGSLRIGGTDAKLRGDRHIYDPRFDGENSPTMVGSASNSEREQLLAKDAESEDEAGLGRR